jgi:3-oxoacyl-[acyl-carrier-protein] synthase-1
MNIYLTDYRTASTTETEMMEDIPYPQRVHWFADTYKNAQTGLVYAPHKLADKVLDPELLASLRERQGKTAFILAAGNAHFAGVHNKTGIDNRLTYDYKFLALSLTQVYAGRIAQMCGANDMVITDSSACASSLKVMMNVRELFMLYGFDRVIVLTLEDAVSNPVLKFFGESKASLTKEQEEQGINPSAFDDYNYGFNIGQGAALAIFESAKYARNSKAQLLGAYTAAEESTNAIGQREDGQGFVRAAAGALQTANISSSDIQLVKTHGTGTKSNNQAEKTALQQIFHTPFIATSYKQRIGHTMGASGLLETCLLLDDIQNGLIPAIPNRTKYDNVFISNPHKISGSHNILSLAAGMGNVYSAAIFKTL